MKAVDYWTSGCYFTVFTALIEYCLVLYLTKRGEIVANKIKKQNNKQATKVHNFKEAVESPSKFKEVN